MSEERPKSATCEFCGDVHDVQWFDDGQKSDWIATLSCNRYLGFRSFKTVEDVRAAAAKPRNPKPELTPEDYKNMILVTALLGGITVFTNAIRRRTGRRK